MVYRFCFVFFFPPLSLKDNGTHVYPFCHPIIFPLSSVPVLLVPSRFVYVLAVLKEKHLIGQDWESLNGYMFLMELTECLND